MLFRYWWIFRWIVTAVLICLEFPDVRYTHGPATGARRPPEKGVLFGYPIVSKKRDGIMVNAETLSGGCYKIIFDYLIISHFLSELGFIGLKDCMMYFRSGLLSTSSQIQNIIRYDFGIWDVPFF